MKKQCQASNFENNSSFWKLIKTSEMSKYQTWKCIFFQKYLLFGKMKEMMVLIRKSNNKIIIII